MEKFIKERGWYTWYNPNYWVNRKFESPSRDHTNYGMTLEDAYINETKGKTPGAFDLCYFIGVS